MKILVIVLCILGTLTCAWAADLPEPGSAEVSVKDFGAVGDGKAFEVDVNDGWLLAADGAESALEHGSKTLMASRIADAIAALKADGTLDNLNKKWFLDYKMGQ